jgi:hypothetical protein
MRVRRDLTIHRRIARMVIIPAPQLSPPINLVMRRSELAVICPLRAEYR